jgi:chaperonin GroES
MKIKPTEDRILVKRHKPEEKTSGGIIIPDNSKEKPARGEILEIGPGRKNDKGEVIPMSLKKGQSVIFGKWSGSEVDGEDIVVMKESDVIAVIE